MTQCQKDTADSGLLLPQRSFKAIPNCPSSVQHHQVDVAYDSASKPSIREAFPAQAEKKRTPCFRRFAMFSCCHAAASPETEEVFAPSLLEGYASSKASKEVQSGYAAPAAFGFKDRTPGIPHVVLSTKFREHWTEVSKQVKTELEKLGVTVYNPNVDNEMMYGKDEGDARWLRTFQDNLKQASKELKGHAAMHEIRSTRKE